ncbi:hypothetical protein HEK616_57310 [Streptomyces nigrescens]|uniref:Uncharacterized protein n=1 Tax=Streptomyces nigrescens TaxID=1920 RepID=A0ABM8A0U5_STRNI|nr:hypothetical protein HEK616_57310 [Streptomyces nigrescens]
MARTASRAGGPGPAPRPVICDLRRERRAGEAPDLRRSAQIAAGGNVPARTETGTKDQVRTAEPAHGRTRPVAISKNSLITCCATLPVSLPSDKARRAVTAGSTVTARGSDANKD